MAGSGHTNFEGTSVINSIVSRLRLLEGCDQTLVQSIIQDVEGLSAADKKQQSYHTRVNNLLDVLLKYTVMDFKEKAPVSDEGDEVDAIAIGINTLAEELEAKIEAEKKHVKRLKEQNIRLERTNKELASFAYVSSHDLQEPLRKINTYISRISAEHKNELPEQAGFYFDRISAAASRMQNLIRDILDYSGINTTDEEVQLIDLNHTMKEVLDELGERLAEVKAEIKYDFICGVKIIPFQFKRLMCNLIGNSIKFRHPERPLKIEIRSSVEEGKGKKNQAAKFCHINYSDNGIGFENNFRERIFEVFQRLHNQSEYQGTGIGLAICKRIVENHGGSIQATGKPGEGVSFDIDLLC